MPGRNVVAWSWPNDYNIMQHPQMLHEKFDHFQIWANNTQHITTCRNTSQQGGQTYATSCSQQCCDRLAGTLLHEPGQTTVISCNIHKCCTKNWTIFKFKPTTPNMSQHVATGWPNARNMLRPTMLWYVALTCSYRLAEALQDLLRGIILANVNFKKWTSRSKIDTYPFILIYILHGHAHLHNTISVVSMATNLVDFVCSWLGRAWTWVSKACFSKANLLT